MSSRKNKGLPLHAPTRRPPAANRRAWSRRNGLRQPIPIGGTPRPAAKVGTIVLVKNATSIAPTARGAHLGLARAVQASGRRLAVRALVQGEEALGDSSVRAGVARIVVGHSGRAQDRKDGIYRPSAPAGSPRAKARRRWAEDGKEKRDRIGLPGRGADWARIGAHRLGARAEGGDPICHPGHLGLRPAPLRLGQAGSGIRL